MEINLNSNIGSMKSIDAFQVDGQTAQVNRPETASKRQSAAEVRHSEFDPIKGSEPVADVEESALTRDDALGKLVNSAFSLPPPPMPAFQ